MTLANLPPGNHRRLLKGKAVEQDVLTLARERMRHVFDLFDHVAVSFSGGKDSTAVLNLALEVARERGRLPLDVFFFDEECIYTENVDYVHRVAALPEVSMRWLCIPVKHRNACSGEQPYWSPWAPEDRGKWVREIPEGAITELPGYHPGAVAAERLSIPEVSGLLFPPQLGNVCMVLGIRADESMTRRRAVSRRTVDNYIVKHNTGYGGASDVQGAGNVWKAYPIYDWRTPDVWLAPKLLDWDYCRVYDLLDKMGWSPSKQRLAPPFGEEPMQGLSQYHACEPELWERMLGRVEGVATAKRYSRTELYAFGEVPARPPGTTYPEFLRELIAQSFEGDQVAQVAKAIAARLRNHFNKTGDALAPRAPHPISGYSWEFLLRIAVRGDFKGRRQPPMGLLDDRAFARRQAAYDKDLAEYHRQLAEEGVTP